MKQQIRFLTTPDNVMLAWAEAGQGQPLVKASNWLTHLEYDWESPVWKHWTEFFAQHFRYIRYDERGCGLTDWHVGDLSFSRWPQDLEAVTDAADINQPFTLLGISQGAATAVAYAVQYPERVSKLILYGGYAAGARKRNEKDWEQLYQSIEQLARFGWDRQNPAFRQVFTSRFIPEGNEEQMEWFNELCRKSTTPAIAAELIAVRAEVDVHDLLPQVTVPTLVVHACDDEVVPFSEGKKLASGIPNARFVQLDSCNHVLLEHEQAWREFKAAVLEFIGHEVLDSEVLQRLSKRERDILLLLTGGNTNAQIGWELNIAEKTVRNHISNLYAKLGIHSRAQAIVLAHEYGLYPR